MHIAFLAPFISIKEFANAFINLVHAPIYRPKFELNIFQELCFPLKRHSARSELRGYEVICYLRRPESYCKKLYSDDKNDRQIGGSRTSFHMLQFFLVSVGVNFVYSCQFHKKII